MGQKQESAKGLLKLAAFAGLAVVNPAAGAAVAGATFLKSARKYARSGDPKDARGMLAGYADLSGDAEK